MRPESATDQVGGALDVGGHRLALLVEGRLSRELPPDTGAPLPPS